MCLCVEMLGPGRLAPQLISPQLDATWRLGGLLCHTSMVTLAATSPSAATAMAAWGPGASAQRNRPTVGSGRFTHPGRAALWAGIHEWPSRLDASTVLPDPADISPPLRMLGQKSMLGQK